MKTLELKSAIETFLAADIESHFNYARNELIKSIYNLVIMICEATNIDISLEPINTNRYVDGVKSSNEISDELMVYVESVHNLHQSVYDKYSHCYVSLRLLNGVRSVGRRAITHKQVLLPSKTNVVSIKFSQFFQLEKIMVIPKSTIISLEVFGVLKIPNNEEIEELVGYTFLPLYNHEGYFHQGKAALPLYRTVQGNKIIEPWGPRPLIRSSSAEIIVVSTVEYQYQIEFPRIIEHEHVNEESFDLLKESERLKIMKVIDKYVSGDDLTENDKYLIWSNRKTLMNIPDAFGLVLDSVLSWDCLCLSNIYPLLEKWAPPLPQAALHLLLPLYVYLYVF